MAELALAIIPIGLKACSALVSYLSGLKDRDDALARLTRQAKSLEGCFQLLDTSLNQGHLDPTRYRAVSHIILCLKNCEEGLNDLKKFEQTQRTQNRLEQSLQKLHFPLRKAHLEELESILDRLCQPLSLAIQNLQLEIDLANSSALSLNTTNIQQTTNVVSNLHTAVGDLTVPVNTIQSSLPLLQDSVDNFIPQINLVIESRLQAQTENIRQALQEAETAAIRRHNATNELLSQLTTPNSDRVSVVARLASRPSAVAELGSYTSTCSCLARLSSVSKTFQFGSFLFRENIVTNKPHMKECPLYVANLESSRRRTLSLTAIMRLLNSAVQLTLCTSTGAGGFAISPSLMYFGVVSGKTAPAFQVLMSLGSYAMSSLRKEDQDPCLKAALRKLQEIFRSGRARPTDVNQYGWSLLHTFANVASFRYWFVASKPSTSRDLEALLDFLIAIGTPVDLLNSDGELALHLTAPSLGVSASVLGKLCFDDAESYAARKRSYSGKDLSLGEIIEYDRENKMITEALYGPLSQAIIRCDKERAQELIEKCPERLEEMNLYGTTAIYLAVEKPEILKLIVSKARPVQLVQSNLSSSGTLTPLGRAMEISGLICNSEDSDAGSRCPCVAATKILLDANCPIIPARDFKNLRGYQFGRASEHCKTLVSQALKDRRRELGDMARKRLLKTECRLVDPSVGELDFYAIEVDRILYRKHLTNSGRLSTIVHDDISHIAREKRIHEPVYLFLDNSEDASIFFNLGFLDIDEVPPHAVYLSPIVKDFLDCVTPQYAVWLHKHLPRLWAWISLCANWERVDLFLAHVAGRYISDTLCLGEPSRPIEGLIATIEILENAATDNCSCLCAPSGCSPLDLIVRWLAYRVTLPRLEQFVPLFLVGCGKILRQDQFACIVRQATFQALEMTHTCLEQTYSNVCWHKDRACEEMEASKDDHEKARYLDDLVSEFEDFMLGRSASLEHTPPVGSAIPNVRSHGYHVVSHERALMFWNDVWPDRVKEIKKRLETTWDPDVETLNELSVSLWFEKEEEDDDVASETSEDAYTRRLDDFLTWLDKI